MRRAEHHRQRGDRRVDDPGARGQQEALAQAEVGLARLGAGHRDAGADEAIAAHQRVSEPLWREALKGPEAAAQVRELLAAAKD